MFRPDLVMLPGSSSRSASWGERPFMVSQSSAPVQRYDLAVIGGGLGGLATAALAQRCGLRTVLLEAHTKLGGCAGHYPRGPYCFDVGATALMGVEPGEPLGELLALVGSNFDSEATPSYRVHMPDRRIDIVPDPQIFEAHCSFAIPEKPDAQRRFWRLQQAIGSRLFQAAGRIPRLSAREIGDLIHDLRILGVDGTLAASTWLLTVDHVLTILGLKQVEPFRTLIAMLLQDTAQAGPEQVPMANASACLEAYRIGMRRPRGGMRALAEAFGEGLCRWGGDLRTASLVDRVEPLDQGGFRIVTRRKSHRIEASQVAFNLPLDRALALLDKAWDRDRRLAARERQSRAAWSAFTAYLVIDRDAIPDYGPLFHQVLQSYGDQIHDGNNALISLSTVDDPGYGPSDVRVATISTHVRPSEWFGLDREVYRIKKQSYAERLLQALGQALPDAPLMIRHAEFGTPRSFLRYTRRTEGAVGGPPVRFGNSNFLAVGNDVLGKGLWVVGDSVFPGQGTLATALSGIRVVERITGQTWSRIRSNFQQRPEHEPRAESNYQPGYA